ncbi:MAG: lysophospholipid acyltransferase family protein [Chloroflexi bacterium]|nr:lysophospholipid acyltransferase family protein [Chloroflexota bacterium]
MKVTIFNTPILSEFFHQLTKLLLRAFGWRVDGKFPDLPKFVVVGAPHTSNWDFLLFLGVIFQLRANVRFMGKAELFNNPFGWFFYWCGGIPVDRSKSTGLVEQMVQACKKAKQFVLVIAPEGTRHRVTEWKMGFYHIAKSAGIPMVMAVVDGIRKTVHVGQVFHPTDDAEADMKAIKGFFAGMAGINPRRKYITLEERY